MKPKKERKSRAASVQKAPTVPPKPEAKQPQPIIVTSVEIIKDIVIRAVSDALPKTAQPSGKRLLSPRDVEEEYGIPERTLERWRACGNGPPYTTPKSSRRIYYERHTLEAYLEAGRVQTTGTDT